MDHYLAVLYGRHILINNSVFDVAIMFIMGLIGLFMLRFGFPQDQP